MSVSLWASERSEGTPEAAYLHDALLLFHHVHGLEHLAVLAATDLTYKLIILRVTAHIEGECGQMEGGAQVAPPVYVQALVVPVLPRFVHVRISIYPASGRPM
jgi:hypothetical protein